MRNICSIGEEDGVASVVALMLLLAVIVTFLSLYATTYLPALKQQAEIEQVTSVKEAFMRFDNDMEQVISDKKNASYGEMIRLGGGEILINPEKSSGTLSVGEPRLLYTVTLTGSSGVESFSGSMANVTYIPSYSFWEDQGYSWQYGYINVTKGKKETPLSYNTMNDVNEKWIPGYAGKFLEITPVPNATTSSSLDGLVITAVTIVPSDVPDEKDGTSGNGACVLRINSTTTKISRDNVQGDLTVSIRAEDADTPLYSYLNSYAHQQVSGIGQSYSLSQPDSSSLTIPQDPDHPVTVTLNEVRISVYVQ
ncbi:MAG: hypothetical protein LUQ71_10520 [Methanoregula sp.]|nr:hypothetical protein [Methanoregula sp.]